MFNSSNNSAFKLTVLLLVSVLLASTSACMSLAQHLAKSRESSRKTTGQHTAPKVGLHVMVVDKGSPAQKAGLQAMDIIYKYGEYQVVDKASFFAARDAYENGDRGEAELTVWSRGETVTMTVPPGRLGIETAEHNGLSYKFYGLMDELNASRHLPQDELQQAIEKGRIRPAESILQEARALLDGAEREGTLTPAQILVARIYMTLDDASPEDLRKQSEMLARLCATQPRSYISYLGYKKFFKDRRYRAAVECFKHDLKANPADVSTRLNLGVAYNSLWMFEEADEAADYVLGNRLPLSDYGFGVAFAVKALAALGRGDYAGSMAYAEKTFELDPTDYKMSLWQLAAAQHGDLKKFYEVSSECREALPEDYERLKRQSDAVEAYALVRNGQRDRARQTIMRWKGTAQKVNYWSQYPGGSDVVKTWKELLGSAD